MSYVTKNELDPIILHPWQVLLQRFAPMQALMEHLVDSL